MNKSRKNNKIVSYQELLDIVAGMSQRDMRKLNTHFLKSNDDNKMDKRIHRLVTLDLQERLKELEVNTVCPHCGSVNVVKQGTRENGIQRLICKDCNHAFTYFTGTLLEKTKYHWDFWVEMIYQMLSYKSLKDTKEILETELHSAGMQEKTILKWRLKIMEASKSIPLPKLTSITEIDETFIREGQKGSLELVDPLNIKEKREARKTGSPSKVGVMGPEFGTVVVAVDHSNHVVAKYMGVGACNEEAFETEFHSYISDVPWLCTDANAIYRKYCTKYGKNHYVRPSEYGDQLHKGLEDGFTEEQLYNEERLDYIDADGNMKMPFKKFKKLKEELHLGLGHVNAMHNEIKQNLVKRTRGISLVHVSSYISWWCFLQNYAIDKGHRPVTKKDAEEILIILLKAKTVVQDKDVTGLKPDFSNIGTAYKNKLIQATNKLQEKANNVTRVLTPEDVGPSFNKRDYLENLQFYKLKFLLVRCKIPGRTKCKPGFTYKFVRALEVHPELEDAIAEMRAVFETYQEQ